MSDANRVSLRYVEEVTAGTTPASPTLTEIKLTGTSDMGFTPETTVSEVIRSDRQENDLILINGTVGGSFDTELISGVHDDLIEGVLWADSTWDASAIIEATFNGTVTADSPSPGQTTIADTDTNGTIGDGDPLAVGDWAAISDGTNTDYVRVISLTDANTIVVEGNNLSVSSGTLSVIRGSHIINGANQKYFTFEKGYLDHSPVSYEYLRGMSCGTFSLTVSSSSIVTGAFGFTGRDHEATTTRVSGVTESDVTGSTYNASSNVATIGEGGTDVQLVSELSFEIDNSLRELNAVGTLGAFDIGAGTFGVTGSIQTYFEDISLLDKLINNTVTNLNFAFSDGAGNVLIFDFPAIKFSEGVPEVSGKNTDVLLNLGFQAFADPTLGYTMKVVRFP